MLSPEAPPSVVRRAWAATVRGFGPAPVTHDSLAGALWTAVIAIDLFLISNPLVLWSFEASLRDACAVTLLAVMLTPGRRAWRPPWSVVAMLAFGFLSTAWATVLPRQTFDFTMLYLTVAVLALAVASQVDARTIAQGFLLGGVVVVVVSYYTLKQDFPGAAVPAGSDGYMAGVGTNRNILAYTLVISLAFALGYLPRRWRSRLLWALGTGTVLLGIGLAESGTGYLATGVLIAVSVALASLDRWHPPSRDRSRRRRWAVRAAAVLVLAGSIAAIDAIGRLLDRDFTSLSGRVPLWEAIWAETTGVDRWFGAGWGAVWPHPWHPAFANHEYDKIYFHAGVALTHGHNSLLDLLPEIGIVGAALFVLVYLEALGKAFSARHPAIAEPRALESSRVALLGITALTLFGLTEPMSTIPLGWFTIVVLATGLTPASATIVGRRRAAPRRRAGRVEAP